MYLCAIKLILKLQTTFKMKIKHLFLIVLLFVTGMVSAQQMGPIPVNKNVRQGKLSNGLTYYILHNEWPEHVANFYIAQRVGSIQENDKQRGLAHFLEHMAFNGSEHFPDSTLLEFTRSLGVEFGSNLNAYTSIDQTVYNINNVPTQRPGAIDTCLIILRVPPERTRLLPADSQGLVERPDTCRQGNRQGTRGHPPGMAAAPQPDHADL